MEGGFEEQRGTRRLGARIATGLAVATLVAAPLAAGALTTGTPAALLGLPVESIAVLLILLAVSGRPLRWIVASVFGVIVVLAALAAGLDAGFKATIDRAFDITQDWPAVVSAFGVVQDAAGTGNAILIVAVLVAALIAGVIAVARAALRTERIAARSGRTGRVAAAVVATTWILCAVVGVQLWPGVPFAAADAANALAATSAQTALGIREQEAFDRAMESDRMASIQAADLLTGLQGKDVVIAFLESYGSVALQDPDIARGVSRVLEEGGAELVRDGYFAQSAFLTSPTFGGVSWLAHSTLQSGVWIDSQQKYDMLTASNRFTLTRAFADAGWRTVAVVPSNTEPWSVGTAFYGYDAVLNSRNMGYRGPAFSYARVPDQYTWQHLYERELAREHAPVMAEVDFVSSHTPWTPVPRLVPWSEIGNGSVFDLQPAARTGTARGVDRPAARAGGVRTVRRVHPRRDVFVPAHLRPAEPRPHRARRPPAGTDRERPRRGARCADHDHHERPGSRRRHRLLALGCRSPPVV